MVRVDLAAVVLDPDDGRAVVTGKDSRYHSISDLKGATFGISRLGSGSQVMASVLGMNEGWTGSDQPEFKGNFTAHRDLLTVQSMANSNLFEIRSTLETVRYIAKSRSFQLMPSCGVLMGVVHYKALR